MWLGLIVGCIYVERTVWEGDSGGDTGASADWIDPDARCTSDAECPDTYACNGGVNALTDAHGCVERCTADADCKAGSTCLDDGSCG